MCRIEKRQNCGFYNFWYYDHDQEGYDHDLTTIGCFYQRATFLFKKIKIVIQLNLKIEIQIHTINLIIEIRIHTINFKIIKFDLLFSKIFFFCQFFEYGVCIFSSALKLFHSKKNLPNKSNKIIIILKNKLNMQIR